MVGEGTTGKEPSKMVQDAERPTAKDKAPSEVEPVQVEPVQDALLTKEQFVAQMDRLAERARSAGLSPIHAMAQTYAKQGMAILEGLLTSLENAGNAKKKKEK